MGPRYGGGRDSSNGGIGRVAGILEAPLKDSRMAQGKSRTMGRERSMQNSKGSSLSACERNDGLATPPGAVLGPMLCGNGALCLGCASRYFGLPISL